MNEDFGFLLVINAARQFAGDKWVYYVLDGLSLTDHLFAQHLRTTNPTKQ
jgi:hypothetical protein